MPERLRPLVHSLAMILVGVGAASVIFAVSGYSAGGIFSGIVNGAVKGPGAWQSTFRWFVPLGLTAFGVVICFRAGYYNIGAQGQIYLGAIAGFVVANYMPGPNWLVVVLALASGIAGGALWSSIAAVLRVMFGTDEALSTLMLNFIATLLLQYLVNGPLIDGAGSGLAPQSAAVRAGVRVSGADGASWVIFFITIAALAASWFLTSRSRFGLVATLAGRNPEMARWQGASSGSLCLTSFAWAGGLAGLAGVLDVLGPDGRLYQGFGPNIGFTAATVALVGLLAIGGATLAALFFGALVAAIQFLPITTDLPASAFDLLQAFVTVLITAQIGRVRFRKRSARAGRPKVAHQPVDASR